MPDMQPAEHPAISRPAVQSEWKVAFSAVSNLVECRFFVVQDPNGIFCAQAENLPGVFTYGDSLAEVDENMREAFDLALETHLAEGEEVPWQEMHEPLPRGSIRRRVLLNVESERDQVS